MATARELQALYVQQFATEAKIAMAEAKGGKLKKYCDVVTIDHGESYTFALRSGFSVGKTAPNLYGTPITGTEGNTGEDKSFTVMPEPIYGADRVRNKDLNKSMVKATSNFMKGLVNALDVACDVEIIKAIENASGVTKVGDATKDITDDANILAFKQAAFLAVANSDSTAALNGAASVACVMDTRDYANLLPKGGTEGNMLTSSDFKTIQNANGVLTTYLFGCEMVTFKKFAKPTSWGGRTGVVPKGTIYFIPKGAIGYVEWTGSDRAKSEYMELAGDISSFWVSRSVGTMALEPEAIIQFNANLR